MEVRLDWLVNGSMHRNCFLRLGCHFEVMNCLHVNRICGWEWRWNCWWRVLWG